MKEFTPITSIVDRKLPINHILWMCFSALALSFFIVISDNHASWRHFEQNFLTANPLFDAAISWHQFFKGALGDGVHPLLSEFLSKANSLTIFATKSLMLMGSDFRSATLVTGVLSGAMWGLGLATLTWALSRNVMATWSAMLLAYILNYSNSTYIYSISIFTLVSGNLSVYYFLIVLGLLFTGYRYIFIFAAIFHLFIHPTTGIVALPIYISLYWIVFIKDMQLSRKEWKVVAAALILLPFIAAIVTVPLEHLGLLHAGTDVKSFWALARWRSYHSVFLGTSRYEAPMHYIFALMSVFLLERYWSNRHVALTILHRIMVFAGIGVFLLYIMAECNASVTACMFLPLRFESNLFVLLLIDAVLLLFGVGESAIQDKVLMGLWGGVFIVASLNYSKFYSPLSVLGGMILTAKWVWALGLWTSQDMSCRWRKGLVGFSLGILLTVVWLLEVPSRQSWDFILGRLRMWGTSEIVAAAVVTLVIVTVMVIRRNMAGISNATFALLHRCSASAVFVAILSMALYVNIFKQEGLKENILALVNNKEEATPSKEMLDWINLNVKNGTPVLSYYTIPLYLRTRMIEYGNAQFYGFYIYAPKWSQTMVAELKEIYCIDPAASLKAGNRMSQDMELMKTYWPEARSRALEGKLHLPKLPQLVIEPKHISPDPRGLIIYENNEYRIYRSKDQAQL